MSINVLKVAIEAQFKPSLTFYGKQGDIGNKIWEKVYPDWETDAKRIIFKDLEHKEICLTEYRRVLVIREDLGELDSDKIPSKNFTSVFSSYVDALTGSLLLRLGLRIIAFSDCKMKFDELAAVMKPKIYPGNDSRLYELTSSDFVDVSFAAVYKKDSSNVRLQVGPVTRDELLARSNLGFSVDKKSIPEASIFFDIDVFKDKPSKESAPDFINKAVDMASSDLPNFLEYLLEEE